MATLAPPKPLVGADRPVRSLFWRVDWVLVLASVGLATIGAIMLYTATAPARELSGLNPYYWVNRQLMFLAIGGVAMVLLALVDYRKLINAAPAIYLAGFVVLVLVLFLGTNVNGAQAWFAIGPLQIQPAEFAKVALIVVLASYLAREPQAELPFTRFLGALALTGGYATLVLLQPDLGSATVFLASVMGMLLVARANVRHILLVTTLALLSAMVIVGSGSLEGYQAARLTTFFDQSVTADRFDLVAQVQSSQEAISSGQMTGLGFMKGPLTNGGYVAEQRTDFIFSAVGEQFGLLGAGVVLGLFALVMLRVWRGGLLARDPAGALICAGVLSALIWHVFENVGMAMGIMPVTGIPLPLVSYGGSSTIAFLCMIGLVLNVYFHRDA